MDQNRALWDRLLIRRGLVALGRAEALGETLGPYTLQAAIAACHARARTPDETDWPRILLPSVRGDLLAKLGRPAEARAEFEHAASLTRNTRERELLLRRAAACPTNGT